MMDDFPVVTPIKYIVGFTGGGYASIMIENSFPFLNCIQGVKQLGIVVKRR